MKKTFPFLAALFIFVHDAHASSSDYLRVPNIHSLAMGGSGIVTDAFSNPSVMELSSSRSVGVEYFNRYGLKELGTAQGYFLFPNPILSFGVHISSFGYEQFKMLMGRCLLSKRLNERWNIGVSFQYAYLQSELYETKPAKVSTDLGIVYNPFENLFIAFTVQDFPSFQLTSKTVDINEFKSYRMEAGINWNIMNGLLITSYGALNEQQDVMAGIGMEYKVYSCFALRAGVQTLPFLPSIGLGIHLNGFQIDAVAIWHPELGINSGIGLSYSF
ncbi:MAG TPA: hypothetical protein DDZ04_06710 [Parabacteroides sp.]|nr:hypothetical protein [Parabacteroides sp.]